MRSQSENMLFMDNRTYNSASLLFAIKTVCGRERVNTDFRE